MDNKCDCIVHFERKSGKCESIFGYCNQTFQCRNEKFECSFGYCKPNCGYSTDKNCITGCQSTYEDECIPIVQCDDNLKCYGEQVCLKDECQCPEGIPDKKYYCTHSITTTFKSTTHSNYSINTEKCRNQNNSNQTFDFYNDTETFNSTPYFNESIDNNKNFNNSDNSTATIKPESNVWFIVRIVVNGILIVILFVILIIIYLVFSKITAVNEPLPSQITHENYAFIPPTHENRDINENTPQISDSETNDETEC